MLRPRIRRSADGGWFRLFNFLLELSYSEGDTPPKELRIKGTLDGRNIGEGQTSICVVPLNISTFSTQKATSAFHVCIINQNESRESIVTNARRIINDLSSVKAIQLVVDGVTVTHSIKYLWYSDLKALGAVSNLNCHKLFARTVHC